jgi:preprotein translocase subunit SecG
MQMRFADHRRAALRAKIARARKVARLNRYVIVVALLWFFTSLALLFLSTPAHARTGHPAASQQTDTHSQPPIPYILLGV